MRANELLLLRDDISLAFVEFVVVHSARSYWKLVDTFLEGKMAELVERMRS